MRWQPVSRQPSRGWRRITAWARHQMALNTLFEQHRCVCARSGASSLSAMPLSSVSDMQQAEASSQMLSSCAEAERALAFAFEDAPDAYAIPQADHDRVNGGSGQAIGQATYGELLPRGVSMLIHALRLDEQSIFYDLGSGRGCGASGSVELTGHELQRRRALGSGATRSLCMRWPPRSPPLGERALCL